MTLISIACGQRALPNFYVLHHLTKRWEARGIVSTSGPVYDPGADACVLHVDKTRLNDADAPTPPAGRAVINGAVRDISKSLYSTLRLSRDGDWDGPVIVKTDLNHFGLPEGLACLPPEHHMPSPRVRLTARPWQLAGQLPDRHYPVVPSIRDVPGWVWRNPAYIVERFMPERDGDLYCIRGWMFLGSFSYGWRLLGTDHMVKAGNLVRHEFIDDVPDELIDLKQRAGFDFGKFDYVMHEGKPIVLDLNKTPAYAGDPDSPRLTHLSRGIEEFLP